MPFSLYQSLQGIGLSQDITSLLTKLMLIGYARVSTDDQKLDLEHDALRAAGCEKIFEDHVSGAKANRPGLSSAMEMARAGDTLVVWRLDSPTRRRFANGWAGHSKI
jgi:predicted site-specific integrase-resolvase